MLCYDIRHSTYSFLFDQQLSLCLISFVSPSYTSLLSLVSHLPFSPLLLLTYHSFSLHCSYPSISFLRDADGTFQMSGVAELDNVCEALGLELSEEEMEVSSTHHLLYFVWFFLNSLSFLCSFTLLHCLLPPSLPHSLPLQLFLSSSLPSFLPTLRLLPPSLPLTLPHLHPFLPFPCVHPRHIQQ